MGWIKDFFGGKSIFSYSEKGFLKDMGRISEHIDTMSVSEIGHKFNLEIAKEDKSVESQIGKEYYRLKGSLDKEHSISVDQIIKNIDNRKTLLRRWYTEISRGAYHQDTENFKQRISHAVQMLGSIIIEFKVILGQNKKDRVDRSKLISNLNYLEKEFHLILSQMKNIPKKDVEDLIPAYNKDEGDLRAAVELMAELRKKIENTPDFWEQNKKIIMTVEIILPKIRNAIDIMIRWAAIPTYEVSTPAIKDYLDEMGKMVDNLVELGRQLHIQEQEILGLCLHDQEVVKKVQEFRKRIEIIEKA